MIPAIKSLLPEKIYLKLKLVYGWYLLNIKPSKPGTASPHALKIQVIRSYQKKYSYGTLVETGTFMGDMVEAQKDNFKEIISIELDNALFKKAQDRFKSNSDITIFEGDSGEVLPNILTTLNSPAIFWLDGHYSSGVTARGELDCPIFAEIDAIFLHKKLPHVILVDDAREFIGQGDYPTTEELINYIKTKSSTYEMEIKNDIIRITPANLV